MAEDILKDSRFTKYLNDPRYRQIPRNERKIKIDKRFQSMFKDEKFKVKYTVDKRGRPTNETSTENLRRYYDLESGEESSSEDEDSQERAENKLETSGQFVRRPPSESSDDQSEIEGNGLSNDTLVRGKLERQIKDKLHDLEIDYARGEGLLKTDSSSDEESSAASESEEEHAWGELDADADTTEDATKRLAVCNMDWDNMKASDIMVLFNSFLPTGGVIHKVTIYPSEYGLQRMREEEVRGPIELVDDNNKQEVNLSDDGGNEEGSTYNMEKLRRYQLNRLRYYYAVVECDSVATAEKLYSECDGIEYESSASKLDLRFISDDTTFEQEPKEVCTKLPDLSKYKPRLFTTTALQQAKVDLTWDTTNPSRAEVIKNALDGQIDDLEIKEYLASSSDDEDEDNEEKVAHSESEQEDDPINKYKSLLQEIQEKEESKKNKDMEMEITWGLGVREKAQELVKKVQADDKDMTPFEKQMQKRREKKKQKKLERQKKIEKLKANESNGSGESSDEDIPSDVDMNDPYFAEEFNKPEFKTKKVKKPKQEIEIDEKEEKRNAELELLLDDDDGKEHFSLKKIQAAENESKKSKRKKKMKEKMKESKQKAPDFVIDVNDERFSALFNSHLFNIDPTDPNYKKTNNMEKLIEEKLKRRPAEIIEETPAKKTKEEAEMSLLVKTIKRKTEAMKNKM